MYFLLFCDLRGHVGRFYCLKWPLGPQGFSTLNFESYSVWYSRDIENGYVPDIFEKPPLVHRKGINQEPKKGKLVLVIGIIIY